MRHEHDGGELSQLHHWAKPQERVTAWRRGMANLAAAAAEQRPVPLEGVNPQNLLRSVKVAIRDGLIEDLNFLSPAAASAALYELASAVPISPERKELGKIVFSRMVSGNAPTFVSLATSLAVGSRRGFDVAHLRSRVNLCLSMPVGTISRADALSLALVSRPELQRDWLIAPSTGSLPSRRLAARLLERAAREAARRVERGDDGGLKVFESPGVRSALESLLNEREGLVWRHVAVARGLLAAAVPHLRSQVLRDLNPDLTPTEWRRAGVSLAASVAVNRRDAFKLCQEVLAGPLPQKDRGLTATMIWGITRAAEAEPELADELLTSLVAVSGVQGCANLVDLFREWDGDDDFGQSARNKACLILQEAQDKALEKEKVDDGEIAHIEGVLDALSPAARTRIDSLVSAGLAAFAEEGTAEALPMAQQALALAGNTMRRLELTNESTPQGRRDAYRALEELDTGLLEVSTLRDLLLLTPETEKALEPLHHIYERLTLWLLAREREPLRTKAVDHFALRMRRTQALLHLVDSEDSGEDQSTAHVRPRRVRSVRVLFRRAHEDVPGPLARVVCATVARGCDALVREEAFEISDVLLAAAFQVQDPKGISTLSEASMVPEIKTCLGALAKLVSVDVAEAENRATRLAALDALRDVVDAMPPASAPRTAALRQALLRVHQGLRRVATARGLSGLAGTWEEMAKAVQWLSLLCQGAQRRLGASPPVDSPGSVKAIRAVGLAVDGIARDGMDELPQTLATLRSTLAAELPNVFADVVNGVLSSLAELPVQAPEGPSLTPPPLLEKPLPDWLPPSRLIGGFYVVRTIGDGAGGSVFAVRRAEERDNPNAEMMALKVPTYDGEAARALSENEFMRLFREEAGALLSLPEQTNLARFITFDAGIKPKPALVMELVEGPSLERWLARKTMSVEQSFTLLEGIADGLVAMHSMGIGHLDVKPPNVILRESHYGDAVPVLVDFGLAGRRVRPGCATEAFGAPEIWGLSPEGVEPQPQAADVYAYACMAYEMLVGTPLFDAPAGTAMITAHITHDGTPPPVQALLDQPQLAEFGKWLASALRQDPRDRADMATLKQGLPALKEALQSMQWPLAQQSDAA